MAGLVADYGSDNDSNFTDSDDDYPRATGTVDGEVSTFTESKLVQSEEITPVKNDDECIDDGAATKHESKEIDSVSDGDSNDEDDPSSEDGGAQPETQVVERLPNPMLTVSSAPEYSVFSSAYDHVEQAKRSVLEKHVKLTDDEVEKKKNRPVCLKFLKGKCRYGRRCKFSHEQVNTSEVAGESAASRAPFNHQPVMLQSGHRIDLGAAEDEEDANRVRKRRYGVKDSLVPPKMALINLNKQRRKDRPWTVD